MTMSENANLVEGLQRAGFSNDFVTDFILMVEGRISMEEWEKRAASEMKKETR